MDIADTDTHTSHALKAELDGPVTWSKSHPRDNTTPSAYMLANMVPRALPAPTVAAKEISTIPAAKVTTLQAKIARGLVPAAAVFAAVKDPPCDSLCDPLLTSTLNSGTPAAAKSLDENP
jgi:hypothetical protein